MPLVEVEAARTDDQHRRVGADRIGFAGVIVGEGQPAAPPVDQIGLAVDQIGKSRRGRILEVGHEHAGARIERVDDHLAGRRASDFDPAILQVARRRRDFPFGGADRRRFDGKVGQLAGIEAQLTLGPRGEQCQPPRVEPAMKVAEQGQRVAAQHFGRARMAARCHPHRRVFEQRVAHPRASWAMT